MFLDTPRHVLWLKLSDPQELPIADYLPLLRPHGTFVLVGVVPTPLSIPIFSLLGGELLIDTLMPTIYHPDPLADFTQSMGRLPVATSAPPR